MTKFLFTNDLGFLHISFTVFTVFGFTVFGFTVFGLTVFGFTVFVPIMNIVTYSFLVG